MSQPKPSATVREKRHPNPFRARGSHEEPPSHTASGLRGSRPDPRGPRCPPSLATLSALVPFASPQPILIANLCSPNPNPNPNPSSAPPSQPRPSPTPARSLVTARVALSLFADEH